MFDSNLPALVIDIGGGTTDAVLLKVDSTSSDERLSVISSSGERVGGCDFDQTIAISKVGPHIGFKSLLKSGSYASNGIVVDCFSTRDIYKQSSFRRATSQIHSLIDLVIDPVPFRRLYQISQKQLQHQILLSIEEIKKEITINDQVDLSIDYLFNPIEVILFKSEIRSICESETKRVLKIIQEVLLPISSTNNHYRIFLTGGMSNSKFLVDAIQEIIGSGIKVRRMDALQSVVGGLALVARHLSNSENIFNEPKSYRGIPISN
jgi:hypothetical chaperone protein